LAAVQLGKFRGLAEIVGARAGAKEIPPRLTSIQAGLREGEVLLDIAGEREGFALYVIRRDAIDALKAPGDLTELQRPDAGDVGDRAAALLTLARENSVLADVAAQVEAVLPASARLFISPDPRLGNLPLHAISVGGRAWCEIRKMGIVPAAAVLLAPRRKRVGRVLVMGDSRGDLPGARAECLAIASVYGTQAKVGSDCSAQFLREALAEGPIDVLHIATHGRGNPRHGGLASLLLADPSGKPVWTDLAEVLNVVCDAGLVVLSGCSTGLIGRRDSTSFVSVAETVLRAGARSVVACLWPVGDQAAQSAMEAFHRTFSKPAQSDVFAALDTARSILRASDAGTGTVRDGRGRQLTQSLPLEQALNWSAFIALGLPDPFS
jgi:CHAT domain-containing protein